MKANRCAKTIGRADTAEVGVGTMIVFIAAVIVAAIAAAVLVNVAGDLQRKSAETGQETTQEVSSNLFVRDIVGDVNAAGSELEGIFWYVSIAPGAEPLDLANTVLRWKHGANLFDLEIYTPVLDCDEAAFNNLSDGFCVRNVFDAGDGDDEILSEGDRVRVEVALGAGPPNEAVPVRERVDALFMPEAGTPVEASFNTPSTYGQEDFIVLA